MTNTEAPLDTKDDDQTMGTLAEANANLLERWRKWTPLVQPLMADAKTHRERDSQRREAEVRLREAAELVAWHLDRSPPSPVVEKEVEEIQARHDAFRLPVEVQAMCDAIIQLRQDRATLLRLLSTRAASPGETEHS